MPLLKPGCNCYVAKRELSLAADHGGSTKFALLLANLHHMSGSLPTAREQAGPSLDLYRLKHPRVPLLSTQLTMLHKTLYGRRSRPGSWCPSVHVHAACATTYNSRVAAPARHSHRACLTAKHFAPHKASTIAHASDSAQGSAGRSGGKVCFACSWL